jgi:hypothetical protein
MAGSSNDLVVAKLDGDAFHDLATVTAGGIIVRKGIAGAAFGANVTWPAPAITIPRALDCLDVNGDAIPDLVATGDALVALVNGGNANFGGQIVTTAANSPLDVALGDFDLDGKVDAMVGEGNGAKIGFYPGHGDGTFGTRVPLGPGGTARRLVAADLDANGAVDLAIVSALASPADGRLDEILSRSGLAVGVPAPRVSGIALSGLVVSPNPLTAGGAIAFTLGRAGAATVSIHDVRGRRVFERALGVRPAGTNRVTLESRLQPGVYWARIRANGTERAAKFVVL